jgi:hypothetical protein
MAGNAPAEFFQQVSLRPGEQLQGFLPNLFSLVIPIQGGRGIRMDEVKFNMVERATDLVVTDQRMVGYKFEEVTQGFGKVRKFFPRFGLDVEKAQEIRVKDNRMEVLGVLTGLGLSTLYLLTGGTTEATGIAQWLEAAKARRIEVLQAQANRPNLGPTPTASHERRTAGGWSTPPPTYPPPGPPPR